MGNALTLLRQLRQDHRYDTMPVAERKAMENTITEAEERGADLRHNGFGGLPSSLALGIYRRDGYRCKKCGGATDLSLHHKGGEKTSRHSWRRKQNTTNNLVVLCQPCHKTVHNEDNAAHKEEQDNGKETIT